MEMRGIEPRAFHMQSERSTTELHPRQYHLLFSAILYGPHYMGHMCSMDHYMKNPELFPEFNIHVVRMSHICYHRVL